MVPGILAAIEGSSALQKYMILMELLALAFSILLAGLIWRQAFRISRWLYLPDELHTIHMEDTNLVTAGLFLFGFYLSVTAILNSYQITRAWLYSVRLMTESGEHLHQLIAVIIQLIVGISIMMGQRNLVQIYKNKILWT